MRYYENLCVGCPQGCIHCGKKHVLIIECDNCGDSLLDDEVVTGDDGEDLCAGCYEELYAEDD